MIHVGFIHDRRPARTIKLRCSLKIVLKLSDEGLKLVHSHTGPKSESDKFRDRSGENPLGAGELDKCVARPAHEDFLNSRVQHIRLTIRLLCRL